MQKTDALVLQTSPYSETTLIVRLLTREMGHARVLAKGARRPKSSLQGFLEPFNCLHTMLSTKPSDQLAVLGETSLAQTWDYLRADLGRLAYAGLGVETLGLTADQSPPEPHFFDEAVAFLDALRDAPGPGSLTIALLLRQLHHSGFPPRLAEPWTGQTLPPTLSYNFTSGVFEAPTAGESLHALRLPARAVAALLEPLRRPPPLDASFTIDSSVGPPILRWLISVWEDHLGARLKSAAFLEKMVLRQGVR